MSILKRLWSDFRDGVERDRTERIARRDAMAQRWRVVVKFDALSDVATVYGPVDVFDSWTTTPEKRARAHAEHSVQYGVWLSSGELVPPHRIALVVVSQVEP